MTAPIYAKSRSGAELFEKNSGPSLESSLQKRAGKLGSVTVALLAAFGCLFLFSGFMLAKALLKYKQAGEEYADITAQGVVRPAASEEGGAPASPYLTVDDAALRERNEDYMGWLDIPNAEISYPVVFAEDYREYLYTTFDKTQNDAGCIFADYRCMSDWTSKSTILYGHRMNDGSMFGTLKKYLDPAYLEAHREIRIYVDGKVLVYEVFSVFQAVAGDDNYTTEFNSDGEYGAWLDSVKARSAVDTQVIPHSNDRVLMLSTCKGGDNDKRTVVAAVLTAAIYV